MPIRNFDKYEEKELWGVVVEEDNKNVYNGQIEYFTTEKAAINWLNKNKITKYVLMQEAF